jgi:PAS domain S-box-containing protein
MRTSRVKILIIEDELVLVNTYKRVCKKMGHESIVASTCSETLEILEGDDKDNIGVILLDRRLPDFDGYELCKLIKKMFGASGKYILLITGDTSDSSHLDGLDAGADDFISKPVNIKILERRISVGVRSVEENRKLTNQNDTISKLYQQNELFKKGLDDSNQPYIITDEDGIITYANRALELFYGYDVGELKGSKMSILNPGTDEYINQGYSEEMYKDIFKDLWSSILDPEIGKWEGMLINRGKDGCVKKIHLKISNLKNEFGEVLGFCGFMSDYSKFEESEKKSRLSCYRTIVDLAELRDTDTGEHLKRLSIYSVLISKQIGSTKRFIEDMNDFAPFHDIGKVGITDSILLAERKLTTDEFKVIKTHPTIGYDILKKAETFKFASDIALCHHEKWDGSGYPTGLIGEQIPLSARITALVDVYDALRSKRPYKEPWTHKKSVDLITSEKGKHFDPTLVAAFLELEGEFEIISDKYL